MSRQTKRRNRAGRRKRELQKAAKAARRQTSGAPPTPPQPPGGEPPKPSKFPKLGFGDLLALIALPLAVAGVLIDNIWGVGICLALATVIPCVAILAHREVKLLYRTATCLFVAAVFSTIFVVWHEEHDKRELAKNEGTLYHAGLPRPPSHCQIGENEFAIFAGGGASFNSEFPTQLLTIGGQTIIGAHTDDSGRLLLSLLRIFDEQGNNIARIEPDGTFWSHPNVRRVRPDWSTLIVYDPHDDEALYLKFINKNTISIRGIFRSNGRQPVVITDTAIKMGGINISGSCSHNTVEGIHID